MRPLQYFGIQRPWRPHPCRRLCVIPVGIVRVWMHKDTIYKLVSDLNRDAFHPRDEGYLRERTAVHNKPGCESAHLVRSKHVHFEHRDRVGAYRLVPEPVNTKLEKEGSESPLGLRRNAIFTSGNSLLIRSWSSFANWASSG